MEWWLGILSFVYLITLLKFKQNKQELARDLDYYKDRCSKFENAYWQLLESGAVDRDKYEIHLPWNIYGNDAIRRKYE